MSGHYTTELGLQIVTSMRCDMSKVCEPFICPHCYAYCALKAHHRNNLVESMSTTKNKDI